MNLWEGAAVGALGFAAGIAGGLAGIGGSMVMLPGLHLIFAGDGSDHHRYMAAAMAVNGAVAIPAALRHRKARAVRTDLLWRLLLFAAVAMVAGVLLSNLAPGRALSIALGAFILAYCAWSAVRLITRPHEQEEPDEHVTTWRLAACGGLTGLVGGLLGLGGGVVMVPMLQALAGVRVRAAIGTSSAVICFTAPVGAALKIATLPEHDQSPTAALLLAALLAPTAIIGAYAGASLTHRLPLRAVRLAIILLLSVAAVRMFW